jgi:histidinol phosphatase-like PHP family hydrolase
MNYLSCIHTHTQFCDGKSTMEEFCVAALERGYRSLGFSPHSPLPYESDWAMKQEDLAAYFGEIARLSALYGNDLEILCGLEWDAESKELPGGLSYVIGSVHSFSKNGVHFSVDYAKDALSKVVKDELPDNIDRRIFIYERASQFDLLSENTNAFMWVSPVPHKLLERYGLVQRVCKENRRVYRDVLIYRNGYKLTALDQAFITELCMARRRYL